MTLQTIIARNGCSRSSDQKMSAARHPILMTQSTDVGLNGSRSSPNVPPPGLCIHPTQLTDRSLRKKEGERPVRTKADGPQPEAY
jgi:hypothetical protein